MFKSVGIIGMGWVGASVAISVLQKGICKKLLLNDLNQAIAEGEAMDLNHGSSFYPSADVEAVGVEDMLDCEAIVITAGRGGRPGQTRLDLLEDNIKIAREISTKLHSYGGILIVVSNPVDVLTYFYREFTGLPASRVIGTGTFLDTVRLRESISDKLRLDPKGIHAHVIGEHGDSEVVLWSKAVIGGTSLRSWKYWKREYEHRIAEEVRTAAYEIIKRKGATNHAIGLVTATLLKWIAKGERRIVTLSIVLNGAYGLREVALSLPCLVSDQGVEEVLEIDLDPTELEGLYHSASVLKNAIQEAKKN